MDIHITIQTSKPNSRNQQRNRAAILKSWYRTFSRSILTKRPALSRPSNSVTRRFGAASI
jgi:hypothetical protein